MKRTSLVIPFVALLALAVAATPTKTTVAGLLKDPKLDKKPVVVKGKVERFSARTSKAGNAYFLFKLADGDKKVSVYGHGSLKPEPKNGQTVEVTGLFAKERKLGERTFKDEIDVSPVKGQKYGIKILKSK